MVTKCSCETRELSAVHRDSIVLHGPTTRPVSSWKEGSKKQNQCLWSFSAGCGPLCLRAVACRAGTQGLCPACGKDHLEVDIHWLNGHCSQVCRLERPSLVEGAELPVSLCPVSCSVI